MDLLLHKFLKESKIEKKDFNEVSKVLTRLLNEKYNEKVIMEQLVHKANFDKDVFYRYWYQALRENPISYCRLGNMEKATKIGFDNHSAFGSILVGLADYFIENETSKE